MKKIKGYIKADIINNPKEGDFFVWFKDNKWCFGTVTGEGCEAKTRVVVDGVSYETHTNTLNGLVFFNEDKELVCEVYDKDWEELINLELINADKIVELNVEKEYKCSYPGSCECSGEDIDGCLLSYARTKVSLSEIKQKYPKNVKSIKLI